MIGGERTWTLPGTVTLDLEGGLSASGSPFLFLLFLFLPLFLGECFGSCALLGCWRYSANQHWRPSSHPLGFFKPGLGDVFLLGPGISLDGDNNLVPFTGLVRIVAWAISVASPRSSPTLERLVVGIGATSTALSSGGPVGGPPRESLGVTSMAPFLFGPFKGLLIEDVAPLKIQRRGLGPAS